MVSVETENILNAISLTFYPRHSLYCANSIVWLFLDELTSTGFLLRITKLSALCIKNLVNLWLKSLSISSACLILMLNRIELTEGSIRTLSFSFLEMIRGWSKTSFEDLASTSGSDRSQIDTIQDEKIWSCCQWSAVDRTGRKAETELVGEEWGRY